MSTTLRTIRSSGRIRLLVAATVVLLLAAGCGTDDTSPSRSAAFLPDPPPAPSGAPATPPDAPPAPSGAPTTPPDAPPAPSGAPTTPPDAPPAPSGALTVPPGAASDASGDSTAPPDAPPGASDTSSAAPGDPPPPPPAPIAATEPESEPVYGGTLVFGLEAETVDGWNPTTTQCAVSCYTVMRAIFDPLAIEDENGQPQPYLMESFEANEDYTEWTFKMRPGIEFHDGTPVDVHALVVHLEALLSGSLSAQALTRVESYAVVDDLTLKVFTNAPFAGLPSGMTGQFGFLAAPSQYDDPYGAANPVGTGPFVFKSWTPDEELVVERNPNYWKTDAEGRSLPYLDEIVFRPMLEPYGRRLALVTGDIHVTHSDAGLEFDDFRQDFKTVEERSFLQTYYLLVNNSREPFDDLRARQALAHCTDYETYNMLRTGRNFDIANGPFAPNTPGYLADTGYPGYDLDAGEALWAEVGDPGTITIGTSSDTFSRTSAELLARMWAECGIDVEIQQLDQATLILNAVMGTFQLYLWRNHNGTSLENERVWWHSDYTGGLPLNFGRIRSEPLDAALDRAAMTSDPEELREIAEEINRILAEDVHNVWLYWVRWIIPHRDDVHNLGWVTLPPPGEHEVLNIVAGRMFLTETWLEE